MAKLIVTETKYQKIKNLIKKTGNAIPLSGIVLEHDAETWINDFKEADNIYSMNFKEFDAFKNSMLNAKDESRRIGMGIRFGRAPNNSKLNIAIEAIGYIRDADDKPIEKYRRLGDTFFGKASIDNFVQDYNNTDRDDFYETVSVPYKINQLLALIPVETLKEFAGGIAKFSKVWFQFGINGGNLIVVLSKRNDAGGKVTVKVKGVTGIYLDDHDLIPPPEAES